MRPKSSSAKKPAEQVVKDIRRATRRHFSAEDKIRIVLDGLLKNYLAAVLKIRAWVRRDLINKPQPYRRANRDTKGANVHRRPDFEPSATSDVSR
jgi:hypothetical protein